MLGSTIITLTSDHWWCISLSAIPSTVLPCISSTPTSVTIFYLLPDNSAPSHADMDVWCGTKTLWARYLSIWRDDAEQHHLQLANWPHPWASVPNLPLFCSVITLTMIVFYTLSSYQVPLLAIVITSIKAIYAKATLISHSFRVTISSWSLQSSPMISRNLSRYGITDYYHPATFLT